MVDEQQIRNLKSLLLRRLVYFITEDESPWKTDIFSVFQDIRSEGWPAVLFGGPLRTMLIETAYKPPRDVDLVLDVPRLNEIFTRLPAQQILINRFGGLRVRRGRTYFDVWPLQETWAFRRAKVALTSFATLPHTTFLDVEAIAVDLWSPPGKARRIYTKQDSFFRAIASQTVDINLEENPFPLLSAIRSLTIAQKMRFRIAPRLGDYVVRHTSTADADDIMNVQLSHYRELVWSPRLIFEWVKIIERSLAANSSLPIALPPAPSPQLELYDSLSSGDAEEVKQFTVAEKAARYSVQRRLAGQRKSKAAPAKLE